GELKTRAGRMAPVEDVAAIESALEGLAQHTDGPFVTRLPREPGRRDSAWAQLLTGEIDVTELSEHVAAPSSTGHDSEGDRITKLEEVVASLRRELDELKQKLEG